MYHQTVYDKGDFISKVNSPLFLTDILVCLTVHSMVNPDYVKFQKMKNITCQQALKYQKCLHETMLKSLSVTFLLLRNTMELYQKHYNRIVNKRPKTSEDNQAEQCLLREGIYCAKESNCYICQKGISGKKVEIVHTDHCGLGLFALENINEDDYIVEYTGNITKRKPRGNKQYVAMVTYKDEKGKNNTFYINGENSISLARCCNHSCVFNAKLVKVEKELEKKPMLWIKAVRNIQKGEEITIHYGNTMFQSILDNGGCKCVKCVEPNDIIQL